MLKRLAIRCPQFMGFTQHMLSRKLKLPLAFICMKRTSVCVFKSKKKSRGNRVPWEGFLSDRRKTPFMKRGVPRGHAICFPLNPTKTHR